MSTTCADLRETRGSWLRDLMGRGPIEGVPTYGPLVQAVTDLEPGLSGIDDTTLRSRVDDLRQRALAGEALDTLMVETFAVVRETARRALDQRPYDVQIAAGIALHGGRIAEMQTGEGKTLAAVAPVVLNALAGSGTHVLTFNDYLARRDARWMGPIYQRLGLSVGSVQEGMSPAERRAAYGCDVTYLTAKEAGFDLLRDGQGLDRRDQVHRPFHFALLDEADSILIDEARIPLVIAGAMDQDNADLRGLAELAGGLERGVDFDTAEHGHNIFLNERGSGSVESALGCGNLFAPENVSLLAAVRNALHAEYLLHRDVDYIVRDGSLELVDSFTGRVAENRHWPDGLHAAVEAKEGLRLGVAGRILGSITLQHLLKLYPRLCGMTATAWSAADELRECYSLEVASIPTNRPCIREDQADRIYTHRDVRDNAVLDEVERVHASGRPILVGTVSVAESEQLVARLDARGVRSCVLNAKNDEQEAEIVADAGALGAVTISTNMAGRGTDIRLGGHEERDRDVVVALGGLYVIGTNKHESARIDRQLRGRAGRQGDPGSSRFFVSLEDDLLQRYGIEQLIPRRWMPQKTDTPVDAPVIVREVARAQRIVEGECFDVRRRLYAYADILETQRQYVSDWRQRVLEGRAEHELLRRRADARRREALEIIGADGLDAVESRLTLLIIDRCWSEYLTEMQAIRDEMHHVRLVGRDPLAEFYRTAIAAFDRLADRIDDQIVARFEELEITEQGVDWDDAGLRGPSATWTYMVHDNIFGNNVFGTMAQRPGMAVWAVLLLGPILFVWGLALHWRNRKKRRANDD